MKKRTKFLLTCVLCLTFLTTEAFARVAEPEYTRTIRILKVQSKVTDKESRSDLAPIDQDLKEHLVKMFVNGKETHFELLPSIKEGRVLVPIRNVCKSLLADIKWNPVSKSIIIKKKETEILLTLGNEICLVNGQEVNMDLAPEVIDGRAVVPLRFVGERLGAEVQWELASNTVIITDKSEKVY